VLLGDCESRTSDFSAHALAAGLRFPR